MLGNTHALLPLDTIIYSCPYAFCFSVLRLSLLAKTYWSGKWYCSVLGRFEARDLLQEPWCKGSFCNSLINEKQWGELNTNSLLKSWEPSRLSNACVIPMTKLTAYPCASQEIQDGLRNWSPGFETNSKHCLNFSPFLYRQTMAQAGWLSCFRVSPHEPKDWGFKSQSGHTPRLWVNITR